MPLREHLAEFRRRLLISLAGLFLGAIAGWFAAQHLIDWMMQPLVAAAKANGNPDLKLNYTSLTGAFNQKILIALYAGVVLSSPLWLYQLWAFIVPGLTKKERRMSMAFVATGVPLFVAGIFTASLVLPQVVGFLTAFVPQNAAGYFNGDLYLSLVTRLMLAFGIAYVLPLLLIALNLAHLVSSSALRASWRPTIFAIFVFAAMASPTPDVMPMLALATPMSALYAGALGFTTMVDRRRAARAAADELAQLDDTQASRIETAESIEPASSLDDVRASSDAEPRN